MTESMVVVRIVGGPRCGERFVTPLDGLTEGFRFRYLDHHYKFGRDAQSRWVAIPTSAEQDTPRTTG